MKLLRSLTTHAVLLVAAAVFALVVWTREDADLPEGEPTVTVWKATPERVEQIAFEAKDTKVRIDKRQDAHGRYYVVQVDKTSAAPPPPEPDVESSMDSPPEPPKAPERKTTRLVSVEGAEKLAELLAPLKASRAIGKITKDRAEEFGFKEPTGTIRVKIGGATKELVVGGSTPGGGDYYVKVGATGEVYSVDGQLVRMLEHADARLSERELHKYEPGELKRVKIAAPSGAVELVELKGEGWARARTPTTKDETAGNWMTKLASLSTTEYLEKLPAGATRILRMDYLGDSKPIGFLELYKVPDDKHAKYYVRSERTRWFGQALQSVADQVEQDLPSLLRQ